jgi:hypothetical protein
MGGGCCIFVQYRFFGFFEIKFAAAKQCSHHDACRAPKRLGGGMVGVKCGQMTTVNRIRQRLVVY